MLQILFSWCIISSSISYFLPWISTNNLNIFSEFPIRILCVDATKLSRIDYNGNNNVGNDQFIIRAEENVQIGQSGKITSNYLKIIAYNKYPKYQQYLSNQIYLLLIFDLSISIFIFINITACFNKHRHNTHHF